jgi:toxin ParE1/3/4
VPYRLTRRAEADLTDIFGWSYKTFGARQAVRYRDSLKACCERLAENPQIGRPIGFMPGLRRYEHAAHVLFYRPDEHGILVTAVLH